MEKISSIIVREDELQPFFPEENDKSKLQKLAELITADSQTYFEQKEALKIEQSVDKALKGIKDILRVETDDVGDFERYCQSTPDSDEFRESFAILTKHELVKAVQQAIANILRNSGHLSKGKNDQYDFQVSIDGFLEQRKTRDNNPQPEIHFITFLLIRCKNLGIEPTSTKKLCSFLVRGKLTSIETPSTYKGVNDDETINSYIKQANQKIKTIDTRRK